MRISARHAILLDNRMQALGSSGSSRSSQWDFEVLNVSVSRTLSVERRMIMGMLCSILKPNTRNGVWTHMSSGLAQGNHFDDVRMFREIYNGSRQNMTEWNRRIPSGSEQADRVANCFMFDAVGCSFRSCLPTQGRV